jgi:hypothetical protein
MAGEDNENDDQGTNNEIYQESVGGNIAIVKNSTMLHRNDLTIPINEHTMNYTCNLMQVCSLMITLRLMSIILTPIMKKS